MAIELKYRTNWVANDGSYGYGAVLTFDEDGLSPRQHDIYNELGDEDKFLYVQAILNGDSTTEWDYEEEGEEDA